MQSILKKYFDLILYAAMHRDFFIMIDGKLKPRLNPAMSKKHRNLSICTNINDMVIIHEAYVKIWPRVQYNQLSANNLQQCCHLCFICTKNTVIFVTFLIFSSFIVIKLIIEYNFLVNVKWFLPRNYFVEVYNFQFHVKIKFIILFKWPQVMLPTKHSSR